MLQLVISRLLENQTVQSVHAVVSLVAAYHVSVMVPVRPGADSLRVHRGGLFLKDVEWRYVFLCIFGSGCLLKVKQEVHETLKGKFELDINSPGDEGHAHLTKEADTSQGNQYHPRNLKALIEVSVTFVGLMIH